MNEDVLAIELQLRHTLHHVVEGTVEPALRGRLLFSPGYHRLTSSLTVLTSTLR